MSILFIDYYFPFLIKDTDHTVGGATVQIKSWVDGLNENKQETAVLTFKNATIFIEGNSNYKLIESYDRNDGIPYIRVITIRIPSIYKAIKKFNPDVIIRPCAGFNTGITAMIAKILKIPFIYRVANDIDSDHRIKKRLTKFSYWLYKIGLKLSSGILCQNLYQYNQFKKKFPNKPILTIHNPFTLPENLDRIKELNERKYIAWIGIFQKQKNLQALFDIAIRLPELEFRIAGKAIISTDNSTLVTIEKLKELNNVKFVGYIKRSEIITFLSHAYILLNTSHHEGFSNTYLESLAAGTPIVTSSKTDPDSIISENGLGVIINDWSNTEPVKDFLNDKEKYFHTAVKCREYVTTKHNPKFLAGKLIDFLSNIKNITH